MVAVVISVVVLSVVLAMCCVMYVMSSGEKEDVWGNRVFVVGIAYIVYVSVLVVYDGIVRIVVQ